MPRRRSRGPILGGLEQLDHVPGWILDEDLRAARTSNRLIAKGRTGGTEPLERVVQVVDLDDEAVPATRLGSPAVGHGPSGRAPGTGQPEGQVAARHERERRAHLLLELEPEG